MEFEKWNRMQIEKIRGYIEDQTGLDFERVSLEEKNNLALEWIAEYAEKCRRKFSYENDEKD